MHKSQFQKIDHYDWFCAPGSQIQKNAIFLKLHENSCQINKITPNVVPTSQTQLSEQRTFHIDHVLMTAAEAFGAGVETTSTTLLWTIAFLLHHPQVQERVHSELDECVGQARAPSLSDRSHLPLLDAVLCEVMRIRPVSPVLIPHVAMQDTSLGGHSVPKGTRVLVNMWAIHHDPKHWDEPEQFRPERFLDSSGRRVTPSSFLPFGAGPRVCVGESLARIELFLFASRLLQCFHFSVPPGASLPELGHECMNACVCEREQEQKKVNMLNWPSKKAT
uniref:Cytochrome P450, family 17, subfamily A, polypeptide 2 n=1 Tax=Sinocyclocheilus anshuiensis TaxID=1608454 RepID=A0A671K2Q8_9TELE